MTQYQSGFKSPEVEAAYMAIYDKILEKWPAAYEAKYVPTSYGDTFVIISGPEDGEPLVLLHGQGGSSTIWISNVADLSKTYRVYAVDIMGDIGKSKQIKAFDRTEFADWITTILDELKIEKTNIAGISLGGFLTTSYAIEKPERVKKIVLIAPAATLNPFSKEMLSNTQLPTTIGGLASDVHGARLAGYHVIGYWRENFLKISKEELQENIKDEKLAELMSLFEEEPLNELAEKIDSLLKNSIKVLYAPGNFVEDEFVNQMLLGMKYGKVIMGFGPYPLPDEELRSIKVPTLLIVGDKEVIYELGPEGTIKRAEELIENIQTKLVPNASHMVNIEQAELVNSHILNFLSGDK
jgi:pimeloyl-ACP methyl ester carboxylesterase